jgi:hypothetical protein
MKEGASRELILWFYKPGLQKVANNPKISPSTVLCPYVPQPLSVIQMIKLAISATLNSIRDLLS